MGNILSVCNRDAGTVNRALLLAVLGLFLALIMVASSDVPVSAPSTNSATLRQAIPVSTNAAAVRAQNEECLRLRRAAIDARRAYLAAREAHPEIEVLNKRIRPLIDQVNTLSRKQAELARANPGLSSNVVPTNGNAHAVVPVAAGQEYAALAKVIAERKAAIQELVQQQNSIADADASLLALKAETRRATEACAVGEVAAAKSRGVAASRSAQP